MARSATEWEQGTRPTADSIGRFGADGDKKLVSWDAVVTERSPEGGQGMRGGYGGKDQKIRVDCGAIGVFIFLQERLQLSYYIGKNYKLMEAADSFGMIYGRTVSPCDRIICIVCLSSVWLETCMCRVKRCTGSQRKH